MLPWEPRISFGGNRRTPPRGCRRGIAAPQFRPLTEANVQDALAQVKAAAAALDQRFATAGTSADGWKEYLSWDQFKGELQKAKPDKAVLSDVYDKLAAGYEGLELKWFANLRTALGNYLQVAALVGNSDLEAAFKSQVEELTQQIKSLSAHPTTDETRKIADHLVWLETARQAPELVREIRQRFSMPNFHAQLGGELLGMGVGGPIDDVAPVDDVILGTVIHGTGHTVGQTKASLTPNPAFATFDALLDAVNDSNNVGRNGPVCIYSTGRTCLSANKRFWLDEAGLHAHPAQAAAEAHTTINNIVSIKGRKFVEKIAWRKAGKQLGQAEAIASQHAASRLGARVNAQADPLIQKANEQFEAKGRKPLDEHRGVSPRIEFRHARRRPGDPWRGGPGIAIGCALGPAGTDPSGRCLPPHPRVDDQQHRGNRPHGHAAERRYGAADPAGSVGTPARTTPSPTRTRSRLRSSFPRRMRGYNRSRSRSATADSRSRSAGRSISWASGGSRA